MNKKEYSNEQQEALNEFNEASREYSRECALFARIRRALPPKDKIVQPEQIVIYTLARQRVSAAAKKRKNAETKFNSLARPVGINSGLDALLKTITDAIKDIKNDAIVMGRDQIENEPKREQYAKDPEVQKLLEGLRAGKAPETLNLGEQTSPVLPSWPIFESNSEREDSSYEDIETEEI